MQIDGKYCSSNDTNSLHKVHAYSKAEICYLLDVTFRL